MSKGYVYVLSNPCMPGIVKIGRSIHGGKGRADDLYRNDTGVPMPFELEFEITVPDAVEIESAIHTGLACFRVNPRREFFKVTVSYAIEVVLSISVIGHGHTINTWPDDISVRTAWAEVGSEINALLAEDGYRPISQHHYAVELTAHAYCTLQIVESIKANQNHAKEVRAARELNVIENANSSEGLH